MKLFPWFQSDIADSPGEAISVRNILSSTPEMRKLMDGSGVNIFYQNIPTSIEVSPQCELETRLLGRIRPSINVKVLTWVVATDQRSAGTSLGWDSLVKSLIFIISFIGTDQCCSD